MLYSLYYRILCYTLSVKLENISEPARNLSFDLVHTTFVKLNVIDTVMKARSVLLQNEGHYHPNRQLTGRAAGKAACLDGLNAHFV